MSKWPGKTVIGLTGNIGTGKSVVRRMLEHCGAYGLDADALAHRAIAKGAPGYQPVIDTFGRWILGADGQVDRAKLGRLVFSDSEALKTLELIVHPLVNQAIDLIVRRATQPVVVIEAIKLLEAGLGASCDTIWVTHISVEKQVDRLVKSRGMSEADARRRIAAQPPQEAKLARAQVVIDNSGSFESTWKQVLSAWQMLGQVDSKPEAPVKQVDLAQGALSVLRAGPRHSAEIAALINRLRPGQAPLQGADIMAAFGEKAFLLLQAGPRLAGLIGWQVENLVARTTDILIEPVLPLQQALPVLIREMEQASKDLQCEASLVFAPPELGQLTETWRGLGYEQRQPQTLAIQAWQEAAQESMPPETLLFFKQLRTDRVLRPI